jgi:hypothetical protein
MAVGRVVAAWQQHGGSSLMGVAVVAAAMAVEVAAA